MKKRLILRQDVSGLGFTGDVVEVSAGHARNLLIPRGLAWLWSQDAELRLAHAKVEADARRAALEAEWTALAQRLEGTQLTFEETASVEGALFGSVTAGRIAESLQAQGLEVEERHIRLGEPIRHTGEHSVPVHIFGDIKTSILVWVLPKGGAPVPDPLADPLEDPVEEEIVAEEAPEAAQTAPSGEEN